MVAAQQGASGRALWVERVIRRELSAVCGEAAEDVLTIALMFASESRVPHDTARLHAFIHGELKQTLGRVEGKLVAQTTTEILASLLFDDSPSSSCTEAPKWSLTQLRGSEAYGNLRATTRPSDGLASASGGACPGFSLPVARAVRASHSSCMPLVVVSEFPESAHEISRALKVEVEVHHHTDPDRLEHALEGMLPRHPVVVLDGRGRFGPECARIVEQLDPQVTILLWGQTGVESKGKSIVRCLSSTSPAELAMLVEVFLPRPKPTV